MQTPNDRCEWVEIPRTYLRSAVRDVMYVKDSTRRSKMKLNSMIGRTVNDYIKITYIFSVARYQDIFIKFLPVQIIRYNT